MQFQTRVHNIPCQCKVISFDSCLPTDHQFHFKILDRKGYPAPWLERYVTPDVAQELREDYHIMFLAEQQQPDSD